MVKTTTLGVLYLGFLQALRTVFNNDHMKYEIKYKSTTTSPQKKNADYNYTLVLLVVSHISVTEDSPARSELSLHKIREK